MNTNTPDFIAIGDTVIDAFIRLQIARELPNAETGTSEICMPFGDKIPYEFAEILPAVGNSANAAVSAARLGLSSALLTDLGNDKHAIECLETLVKNGVGTQFVKKHDGLATNYHYVLWFGKERTILIKHEKYPYSLHDIGSPRWLYLSSLGEHSLPFHTDIAEYLDSHPDIHLIFQPGTYQIKFGTQNLERIYKRTKIFFCNLEESEKILNLQTRDISVLLHGLKALGVELPVITDGPKGSYTLIDDKAVFLAAYPDDKPAYERTGAGDSFSSTFSIAIALGHSIEEALKWGSINAMSVCEYVGAQKGLLSQEKIKEFIAKAPEDWEVRVV